MADAIQIRGMTWRHQDGFTGIQIKSEDLYELAQVRFYDALEDPLLKSECIHALLGYFDILCEKELKEKSKHSSNHLLDTCIIFLTKPRSSAELLELEEATSCRCNLSAPPTFEDIIKTGMHLDREYSETYPFVNIYTLAGSFASTIVETLDGVSDRLPTYQTKRRVHRRIENGLKYRVSWPSDASQLIPRGPEDSVRALVQWAAASRMARTAGSICRVIDYLVFT